MLLKFAGAMPAEITVSRHSGWGKGANGGDCAHWFEIASRNQMRRACDRVAIHLRELREARGWPRCKKCDEMYGIGVDARLPG